MLRLLLCGCLATVSLSASRAEFIIDDFTTAVSVGTDSSVIGASQSVSPNSFDRIVRSYNSTVAVGGGSVSVTDASNNDGFRSTYSFTTPIDFLSLLTAFRVSIDSAATTDNIDLNVRLIATGAGGSAQSSQSYKDTVSPTTLLFSGAGFSNPTVLGAVTGLALEVRRSTFVGGAVAAFTLNNSLVAVPEPGSLLLAVGSVLAVGGVGFCRRRRSKEESVVVSA